MNYNLLRRILLVVSFVLFLSIPVTYNISNYISDLIVFIIPLIYAVLYIMYKYTKKKTSLYNILVYTISIPAFCFLILFAYQMLLFASKVFYTNVFDLNFTPLLYIVTFLFLKDIIEIFYKQNFTKKTNVIMIVTYLIVILTSIKFFYFLVIDPNESISNSIVENYNLFNSDLFFIFITYTISTIYKHINK